MARAGSLRRPLAIPNPIAHRQLTELVCAEWVAISAHISRSALSLSRPVDFRAGRALVTRTPVGDLPLHRIRGRAGRRYVVQADISQFYPSIYTHSVPWATMGKALAKITRAGGLGNDLDVALRRAQDGQTVGIPIGPDTSLVVAEIVLAERDEALVTAVGALSGYRYYDDYELQFATLADAEAALSALQETLDDFHLVLNPAKTRIRELPEPIERPWVGPLRRWPISPSRGRESYDLIAFFDRVFEQAGRFPDESVVAYAVGRLNRRRIHPANWLLFQQLLMHATTVEPGVLPRVIPLLDRARSAGATIDRGLMSDVLSAHVEYSAPLGHSSEVAWALWGAITLDAPLSAGAGAALARISDDVSILLALDAEAEGRFPGPLSHGAWEPMMTTGELRDDHWLVAYEASVKGWLPSVAGIDHIAGDAELAALRAADVHFYDRHALTPPVPSTLRSLVAVGGGGGGYG